MQRRVRFGVLCAALLAGAASLGADDGAAESPPLRDPRAMTFVAQTLAAITGGATVRDITFQATATYIAGSDQESGTARLVARGHQESRVVLSLDGGERKEVRQGIAGTWTGPDGQAHSVSLDNCWVDADWFFPALTLQALGKDPTLGVVLVGQETKNGQGLVHLQFFHTPRDQSPKLAVRDQALSAVDFYLDAASYLPVAIDFSLHPDDNPVMEIAVEIQLSDYRAVNGVQVPFHIQRYLKGSLVHDFVVSAVSINSGVPDSEFAIQAPLPGGGP